MSAQAGSVGDRLDGLRGVSKQMSLYGLASVAALGIDTGVYLLMAHVGLVPATAGVVGYVAGMIVHYVLSIAWVFDARASAKGDGRLVLEFVMSGLLGLALTAAVIAVATGMLGIALLPAKVLAVGASFLAVYVVRRTFVFAAA